MGYEFDVNFNHPYNATSLADFWRRWHISLSTWFRDYVYIPLGGSRSSPLRAHANMWITMVVSGFWHGASWTFVIWGALHAAFLSLERILRWPGRLQALPRIGGWLCTALVLLQVWVAWVFFRAESFDQAVRILSRMFAPAGGLYFGAQGPTTALFLGLAILREVYCRLVPEGSAWRAGRARSLDLLLLAALIAACVFLRGPGQAFIYFQF